MGNGFRSKLHAQYSETGVMWEYRAINSEEANYSAHTAVGHHYTPSNFVTL